MTAPTPTAARPGDAEPTRVELPKLDRLSLTGGFAEQVTVIPRSQSSLILATAFRMDEEEHPPVLLPFVEMMFEGIRQGERASDETDPELDEIFARTLPLENALWLSYDVVRDIRVACDRLSRMIEGAVAFDHNRMIHARFYADQVRVEAETCVALIDAFVGRIDGPPPAAIEKKPRRRRAAKPAP